MRVFVSQAGFPGGAYQSVREGSAWSPWRRTITRRISARQPVATNLNGDVNLITQDYVDAMWDQAM